MFRRKRKPSDFSAEIEAHLQLETEQFKEQGLSERQARAAARRAFGNVTLAQECFYESGHWVWCDNWKQDIRYGLRMLVKNPAFSAIVLLTLALGIGANTALFSVVYGTLFRPLPYPHPERILEIARTYRGEPEDPRFTYGAFEFWKNHARPFQFLAASAKVGFNLARGGKAYRVRGLHVSPEYFHVLGVEPTLGRDFLPEEDIPQGPKVAILSHSLWRSQFGGDAQIIGNKVLLDGAPYVVIGIMPERFRTPDETDIWTTLAPVAQTIGGGTNLWMIGRLEGNITYQQAEAYLDTAAEQYRAALPDVMPNVPGLSIGMLPYGEFMTSDFRTPLLALFGATGFLLLMACANVANLFLARSAARSREIAVRIALGARRGRLFCQLLSESMLFGLSGGALGLLLAYGGVHSLLAFIPPDLPRLNDVHLDGMALAFTGFAAILTGLLFGLAPAFRGSSTGARNEALNEGAGRATSSLRAGRLRGLLTVGEIALSFALVFGAALLIDTFVHLVLTNPGFDPHRVLTLETWITGEKYATTTWMANLQRNLVEKIDTVPGVDSSALVIAGLPLQEGGNVPVSVMGRNSVESVDFRVITPDYFRTLGIPLLTGRAFTQADSEHSNPVVIINQALARQYFSGTALAEYLVVNNQAREVVGMVGDVRSSLKESAPPTVFVPLSQTPIDTLQLFQGWYPAHVLVRTSADPRSLAVSVEQAVHSVDWQLPIGSIRPMEEVFSTAITFQRFLVSLMGLFATLAVVLAAVGTYGVIADWVGQRTHEFGIRMALGAQPWNILKMVLRQAMLLAGTGLTIGLIAVLNLVRFLASQLYGVKPKDPLMLIAVMVVLAAVSVLACLLPGLRAARTDPLVALRCE